MPTYHVQQRGSFSSGFGCTMGVFAAIGTLLVLGVLAFCVLPVAGVVIFPAAQKIRDAEQRTRDEQAAVERERITARQTPATGGTPPSPATGLTPAPLAKPKPYTTAVTIGPTALAITAAKHAAGDILLTLPKGTELSVLDTTAPTDLIPVRVASGANEGQIGFVAVKDVTAR